MNSFERFARLKNYFSQGNLYMAIANFVITSFTWLAVLKLSLAWYILLPLVGLFFVVLVGSIDFYLVKPYEIAHSNTINDMKLQLDRIEARL